ncbi:MAG: DMT family transporter, partial [Pseudomonadota bacterium]
MTPFSLEAGTPMRGIASMLVAGVFLVTNDAITKTLVAHYPVGQILCIQAIIIASLLSIWLRLAGEPLLRIRNWKGHLGRGLLYVVGSFAFVTALVYLPLGEVIAIAFAGPLFLTLFGKLLLKEQVGPHRLFAVILGFIGVIIMMRPSATMHWAVFLPLLVALADGLRDVVTRATTVGESSQRIVLTTALILAVAGAITAIGGHWVAVEPPHYWRFGLSAAAFVVAH